MTVRTKRDDEVRRIAGDLTGERGPLLDAGAVVSPIIAGAVELLKEWPIPDPALSLVDVTEGHADTVHQLSDDGEA